MDTTISATGWIKGARRMLIDRISSSEDSEGGESGRIEYCFKKDGKTLCRIRIPDDVEDVESYVESRGYIFIPQGFKGFGER